MEEWMMDELVKDIPKEKLEFLRSVFELSKGKTQKEMINTILPFLKEAREKGYTFSSQEMTAAIAAIRAHSGADDNKKIDEILKKIGGKGKN